MKFQTYHIKRAAYLRALGGQKYRVELITVTSESVWDGSSEQNKWHILYVLLKNLNIYKCLEHQFQLVENNTTQIYSRTNLQRFILSAYVGIDSKLGPSKDTITEPDLDKKAIERTAAFLQCYLDPTPAFNIDVVTSTAQPTSPKPTGRNIPLNI
jgi:hypothetical protein